MFSWVQQRFGGVFRRGAYTYSRKEFTLDADTCDALRKAVEVAGEFRRAYGRKCEQGQRRMSGFCRDVQNANLMVLREFDRICIDHGFVYMLYNGTLLGASRHAGFIPWDDDVDVIMPREHYERIIDVFNAESRIPSLQAKQISPSRGSVFIKIEVPGEPMIYIDIFPLDCYAAEPGAILARRMEEVRRRVADQVLPDKNPEATYRYYAALRNNLGFPSVVHDDSECRSVFFAFEDLKDQRNQPFDSKDIFPLVRTEFEGLSAPIPANSALVLGIKYKKYTQFPLHIRNHFQMSKPTIERMLNVKRFLRSEPLRPVSLPRRRMDVTERLRDRFLTRVRSLISPAFSVITGDTLKEYRLFSRSIFRLRSDRLLRNYIGAIEMYSRLIQDETPAPLAKGLLRQSQTVSTEALAGVLRVCKSEGLTFWLWLGSLLGAVRNGAFPASDSEAVLLMPRADYERFRPCCNALSHATGLRAELAFRHGGVATVVTMEGKPRVLVIPCDVCPDDWDRKSYAKQMASAINLAAIESLKAENDLEGLYRYHASLRKRMGVGLDSDKSRSIFPGWDCPELYSQCHVLAAKHYAPATELPFEWLNVPVPADHDIVLTSLYGDYLYRGV